MESKQENNLENNVPSDDTKEITDGTHEEHYKEFVDNFDPAQYKKLVRKIDWHLLPILTVLYMFAHLDRSNIGNAKIEGMEADLNMSSTDYNTATVAFFLPYIILEPPSNIILKRYFSARPSIWIGLLCFSWGTVMTLHGVVSNFGGLVAARFFLGVTEAGFFPGAMYLLSSWYTRYELAGRVAIMYQASALSGALSGLLAFGIAKLDGAAGVASWAWIFILEGLATVVVGVATFLILPDAPERCRGWLDDYEIKYLHYRAIVQDGGSSSQAQSKFSWPLFKSVLLDWKLYIIGMIFWSASGPVYGIKFTLPEIITSMGYTSANAQLLSMPPYVVGGISALTTAKISDKLQWRMPVLVGPLMVALTGLAVLCAFAAKLSDNIGAGYFAVCLMTAGYYPITPAINAWGANNLAGPQKRSLGLGYFVAIGNLGSIAGSFMFLNDERPTYPTGFGLSMGFTVGAAVLALFLDYKLWKLNKKKAQLTKEEIYAKYTEEELAAMGDSSPLFKYTL